MDESRPIPSFRCNQIETSKLAKEWRAWKESLECYFAAYGITDQQVMRAKMLHLGGPALQTVFKNLKDRDHIPVVALIPNWYDSAIDKLDEFFEPRHQNTSERRKLRQLKQKSGERFADFIIRLKQQVAECGFEKYGTEIGQIIGDIYLTDAVVEGCMSNEVRRRILMKDLPFSDIEALGISQEGVDQQIEEIAPKQIPEKIFKIEQPKQERKTMGKIVSPGTRPSNDRTCFNCGQMGHFAISSACPARGKQCRKCKRFGHLEKCCRQQNRGWNKRHPNKQVRVVEDCEESERKTNEQMEEKEKVYYAFYSGNESNVIPCVIGGVEVEMLVDSGADANLVSSKEWSKLKEQQISVFSSTKGSSRVLRAYGSAKQLMILGSFVADIRIGEKKARAEFLVVEEGQRCLLGDKTAKQLGVLKVGLNIARLEETQRPFGKIKGIKANIHMDPQAVPVFQPMRRVPLPLEEAVGRKLDELLNRDIIEVKVGPTSWVSPLVIVGKANGEPRLCLDLRRVNEAVMREHHPMPVVDDYISRLGRGKLWSKLDIREAFLQIELAEESRDVTTFITSRGLFRFKRLPFGLVTAPELFQKAMDEMLAGCDGAFWYLDDIIIEGKDMEQHDEHLEKVLARLKNRGVELNWEKCQLRVTELDFLGHRINQKGIGPSEAKVQTILSFREPQNVAEVRSFLGLANYLNKFIPSLATIDEPLRKLLLKNASFEWTREQAQSFSTVKKAIGNVKQLGFYNIKDRTAVIADASPFGLGALLVQFDDDNKHRVITYASKSLTETERRYCQTEKEALAIIWCVERFRYYLLGKEFDILTDCKALSFLFSKRSKPCARIERWVLRLQTFDYRIVHVPGKDNVADTLSRLAVQEPKPFDQSEEIMVREVVFHAANCSALTWREIKEASKTDGIIQQILEILLNGETHALPIEYRVVANELCDLEGVLLRGDRIVIPTALRGKVLSTAHEGHPGITMMKNHLRSNVWWPKLDMAVEKLVKSCRGCTLVAAPDPPEPMKRSKLPSSPWQTLALDFLGPLPEGQHLLVVIDCYSRFMEVCEMQSTTSGDVVRELSIMFSRYGIPSALKADNAPQLSAECTEFREFCDSNGVKILNTIPYWPQSNGEVERQNRSILKRLRIAQELGRDWRQELRNYLLTYHSTNHSTTGKSPGEIMFGRRIKSKLPTLSTFQEDDNVRERDAVVKEKGKEYGDRKRHARESELQEGDLVLAKRMRKNNKLDPDFADEEFIVRRKCGTDTTIQSKETGKRYRRSSAHLKKIGVHHSDQLTNADVLRKPSRSTKTQSEIHSGKQDDCIVADPGNCPEPPTVAKRARQIPAKYRDYISH